MKPRAMFTAVVLTALLALPQLAAAVPVHNLDCTNCHDPSLSVSDIGAANVCLRCHDTTISQAMNDGTPGGTNAAFESIDASNAFGHNPGATSQTSHNWGAVDNQPAAGASAPAAAVFYSRQGSSTGKVTCSRCHNPHASRLNPKLLVTGVNTTETLCVACHTPFAQGAGMTNLSHPINVDYATLAADHPGKYQPAPPNDDGNINTDNKIALNGGKIVCGTCHQVHFADSDPLTDDTPGNWNALAPGNGKILRSYGRVAGDAAKSSDLCQTCHIYGTHGGTHATMGCLDCHGGHSPAGNYYILRPQVTGLGWVPKDGAAGDSDALTYPTTTASWMNAGGTGYCQGCHTVPVDGSGKHNGFDAGSSADCATCHNHSASGGSFTGSCNACHGYAPSTSDATRSTSFAVDGAVTYVGNTYYKNEATTAHIDHSDNLAIGSGNYKFQCNACHNDFANSHKDGNFQDVVFAATANIGMTASYNPAGNGTCATVYCHSNGGKRDGTDAGTRNGFVAAVVPGWQGGRDAITGCTACHTVPGANASATHLVHVTTKGYACNVCHSQTATDSTTLVELGGDHVDGQADVDFDTAYSLGTATLGAGSYSNTLGTCTTYCHSNGRNSTVQTPDWDLAATGDCGDCHAAASGQGLSDSHDAHLAAGLTCDTCHTAGAITGSHASHLDGTVDEPAQAVCNACHGATVAGTGNDREPVWGNSATVDCATCHVGAAISVINYGAGNKTAPAKQDFFVSGHGKASFPANSPECNECHDANAAGHFDGTSGDDDRLIAAATCDSCHGAGGTATTKNGIYTHQGNSCATCHDPHGSSNLDMVRSTSAAFTGTVVFSATTGANSYDEADAANGDDICATCHTTLTHNRADGTGVAHNEGTNCFSCHKPHTDATAPFGMGAGTNCGDCHGYAAGTTKGALTSGAHAAHVTVVDGVIANEDFSDCAACHGAAVLAYNYAPGGAHMDGDTDFTVGLGYNDNGTRGNLADDPDTTCAGACHATAQGQLAAWTATSLNCDTCHGGQSTDTLVIASASHSPHITKGYTCDECHQATVPTDTAHIGATGADEGAILTARATPVADNAEITIAVADWADGTNTCSNAACHDPSGTGYDAQWAVDSASCDLCHSSTNPGTNKHAAHLTSGVAIACNDCHVNNGVNTAHLNGTKDVTGTDITSWTTPTCANNCHTLAGAAGAASWTSANVLACTDCHSGAFVGGSPASGLHATTNALAHDASFQYGLSPTYTCTSCHNAVPTTDHISGGAAQNPTQTTYTFSANIDSYNRAVGCAAKCHDDNQATAGDAGKWMRKWIGVTDARPTSANNPGDAVCDNCHGDGMTGVVVDNSWNTGLIPGHGDVDSNNGIEMLGQHGNCKTCHGWGDADYDADWASAGHHGNGTLSLNGEAGYDDGTTPNPASNYGCTAACHSGSLTNAGDANFNHKMSDSGWTVILGNFGSGDCNTCHAAAGRDHSDATESTLSHDLHTGSEYAAGCTQCHPHDGITVPPGTGIHALGGTVNFANNMPNTYDYAGASFGGNCSTNLCHDTDNGQPEWVNTDLNAGGFDACIDCHDSVKPGTTGVFPDLSGATPTSGSHTLHNTNAIIDQAGHRCGDCHGAPYGTISSLDPLNIGPTDNHVDTTVAKGGELLTYSTANANCTNNCHTAADTNEWTAGALTCNDCHNLAANAIGAPIHAGMSSAAGPATGKHADHVAADSDYVANTCSACHGHQGALANSTTLGHANGSLTYVAGLTYNTGNQSCTNACHITAASDWTAGGALACTDCHTQAAKTLGAAGSATMSATVAPATGEHTVHMASDTYVPNNCTDCHGHSGVLAGGGNLHVNGPAKTNIGVASQITSYTSTDGTCANSCHAVVNGRDWTSATTLNCVDCHNADGNAADLGTFTLDQGNWPPDSNKHAQHAGSNALPQASPNDCFACHDTTVDNTGALKAGGIHLNGAFNVAFNSGYGYEGVAGTRANTGAATTCSNILCHNGIITPAWNSTVSCGKCHNTAGTGPLPSSASTARSHAAHANNDGDFADCDHCHPNVNSYSATGGHADHQNLTVNITPLAGTYTDADGKGGVNWVAADFIDDGTCANVSCHYNNLTPDWGGTITGCTACHNDGAVAVPGALNESAPATGEHTDHVISSANVAYLNDCDSCHGTGANTAAHSGHGNLALNIDNDAATDPATGGSISNWDNTNNTCTNSCHAAGNGDWDNDAPVVGGTIACADCHTAGMIGDMGTGNHAIHTDNYFPATYGATTNGPSTTKYNFYCANCHSGGTHMNNNAAPEVSGVGYAGSGGTCNANYCHSDGVGTLKTTPNWVGGTFPVGQDRCIQCHGNSPGTNAHRVHAVGIHAEDVYTGTTGLVKDAALRNNAHGDPTNSTTINCNVCHNATVTMARNKLGSECVSCHTGDANDATNLMDVADKTKHVDGNKQVAFVDMTTFKSKAQVRDNLADANDGTTILSAIWNRVTGYKAAASHDKAQAAFATPNFAAGNCSNVACHNNNQAIWNAAGNINPATYAPNCMGCHTSLPK